MDNASVHQTVITHKYMQNEGLNIAYIPQYCPEFHLLSISFFLLKHSTIELSKGKIINWKLFSSNELLKKSFESIKPSMVRKIWSSFTKELSNLLELL